MLLDETALPRAAHSVTKGRDNYFYARSVIGRELSMPRVAVAS